MSADNEQPAGDDDNDGFDYSGYLLFNKVCKTSLLGDFSLEGTSSDIERAVFDRLGEFEEGTAKNPGKGYEILDFRNFVYDEELDLPGELIDYAESLVTLRYKYEEYHEEIAEVNPGERKTVQIPATKDVDIFWDYPDHMFFRGSNKQAKKAKSQANTAFGDEVAIHNRNLGGDFLLWLFYNYCHENTVSDSLEFERLSNGEVTGKEDIFGAENTNKENSDLKYNAPTLLGLLLEKSFASIEGTLLLEDEVKIQTEIAADKVQIKTSKAGLKSASDLERMIVGLAVAREISELHEHWENLPPQDKYPPLEFFCELYDVLQNRCGLTVSQSFMPVLREYANKRDENFTDDELQNICSGINDGYGTDS